MPEVEPYVYEQCSEYTYAGVPDTHQLWHAFRVVAHREGRGLWSVQHGQRKLHQDGARWAWGLGGRWPEAEAQALAYRLACEVKVGGRTAAQVLADEAGTP